jgi:hypothetical protein
VAAIMPSFTKNQRKNAANQQGAHRRFRKIS